MYKTEELIYSKIFDVSKETGIPNNKGYIRVVKRTEVKPKNFFRRKEKTIIYFDIEYNIPDLSGEYKSLPAFPGLVPSVTEDIRKENAKITQERNKIYRIVKEIIWEAENYVLNYKLDNCYTNSITRFFEK